MCLSQRRDFILNNNNKIKLFLAFFKEYKNDIADILQI